MLTFYDKVPSLINGTDTPRAYLERYIETIEAREQVVRAFVTLCPDQARDATDSSTLKYKTNRILSLLDGMPFGMKDVFETEDIPMQLGSPSGYRNGYNLWRPIYPSDLGQADLQRKNKQASICF